MGSWIGAWICALAWLGSAGPGLPAPTQSLQPAPKLSDVDARLSRWEESLDLDLPKEVLVDGEASVRGKGDLVGNARAVALVARALARSGRTEDALELLKASSAARPLEVITAERARLALEQDDLDGVIDLLWDSSAKTLKTPAIPDAWWIAGRARARQGNWDQVPALLEHYLELEPRSAQAASSWHLLAQAALRRNDGARAQFCVAREEALGRWHSYYNARRIQVREHPREPLPRLGLAQLLLEAEELARARAVLDELLAITPEFAQGWLALGETQRKQSDLAGARASYDKALALDPGLDIARYNRAVLAKLQGRDEDARKDLEVLLAGPAGRDRRFAAAHLDFARLMAKSGDLERSAAAYARYQEFGGKEKL